MAIRRIRLSAAYAPTSPLASPELQVARYLVERAQAGEMASVTLVANVAWDIIAQRLAGRLSAAERHGLPPNAVAIFHEESSNIQDRLLGYWRKRRSGGIEREVWYPGLAGLEPREAEVVGLAMDGFMVWDIQRRMKPKRDGEPVAMDSVYAWLSDGRRKLRDLFHMPASEEPVDGKVPTSGRTVAGAQS